VTFALDKDSRKIGPVKKATLFTNDVTRCSGAHNYRLGSNIGHCSAHKPPLFVWIGKSHCFARLQFFHRLLASPAKVLIFILILSFPVAVKITIQIIVSLWIVPISQWGVSQRLQHGRDQQELGPLSPPIQFAEGITIGWPSGTWPRSRFPIGWRRDRGPRRRIPIGWGISRDLWDDGGEAVDLVIVVDAVPALAPSFLQPNLNKTSTVYLL
jgi:hypothetical protein